jgi:hypothetical protein
MPTSFAGSDLLSMFGRRCRVKGANPVPDVLDVVGCVVGSANARHWFQTHLPGHPLPQIVGPETRWPIVLLDGGDEIPAGDRVVMICPRLLEPEPVIH